MSGEETLVASWTNLARTSPGASVVRLPATIAATFPNLAPMNNAIVRRPDAVDLVSVATRARRHYDDAGVASWALWIPSPATTFDAPDRVPVVDSLVRDETTVVMRADSLARHRMHDSVRPASFAAACDAGDAPIPADALGEPEPDAHFAAWVLVDGDVAVAGACRYLHGTDCGIYAVGTEPTRRRRGLARRLVAHVLAEAVRRGARTATLQSTPDGLRLYESLGFTAVGRYEEWVPA